MGTDPLAVAVIETPVGFMEGRRRSLRPWHVLVTLEDLLILTWTIPAENMGRHLPRGVEPAQKGDSAYLSALLFRNRDLRPAFLGVPRFSSYQLNVRSYILHPETRTAGSVFFHGLFLSRPLLARGSSWMFGIPFESLPLEVRVERQEERIRRWQAASADGSVDVEAHEDDPDETYDGEMLDLLTNPHTGLVRSREAGACRAWSIWHRPQRLHTMKIDRARIRPVDSLALTGASAPSGLYVPSVDYEVYLPARRL